MATLKQISKMTGVAESTISRVLNRDPTLSISDEKRTLVIETAEKLQYVTPRRRRARNGTDPISLRKPEELVSLVLVHFLTSEEELTRPFYIGLRKGIEARCEAYGINIVRVLEKDMDPASLHNARHTGVLSIGALDPRIVEAIEAHGIPIVLAHPAKPPTALDVAYVDIASAAAMLCEWLIGRGIKRPALVGLASDSDGRLDGYRQVMTAAGSFDPDLIVYEAQTESANKSAVDELFDRFEAGGDTFPDAIIVNKDQTAVEVYQCLQERGLKIPDDISVVGFNDSAVASVLRPNLTTIRLDAGVIGEAAVDLLMEQLAGRKTTKHVQIQPAVTIRASTR
ncbi:MULTISPECIES: LacI family DNA-binding transcriptional regulator [unclassified Meridianimarinicoccus]|uniref:LacI family DNA-binding transcriptional regulator n=1 Tax=unclassified Meridianimarinicoccus TaxID=2923344 RepID=UPI001868072A|nr:LacI family DNA-binding transcriptional regulator [Fluviibacterium sp. MJW13]